MFNTIIYGLIAVGVTGLAAHNLGGAYMRARLYSRLADQQDRMIQKLEDRVAEITT